MAETASAGPDVAQGQRRGLQRVFRGRGRRVGQTRGKRALWAGSQSSTCQPRPATWSVQLQSDLTSWRFCIAREALYLRTRRTLAPNGANAAVQSTKFPYARNSRESSKRSPDYASCLPREPCNAARATIVTRAPCLHVTFFALDLAKSGRHDHPVPACTTTPPPHLCAQSTGKMNEDAPLYLPPRLQG